MTRREIIKQGILGLLIAPHPKIHFLPQNTRIMKNSKNYDVIIIGGSYAGLSAAMSLGRSLKNVLIIDNGLPCNRQTPHSHNFITQDGVPPKDIADKAREQVLKYGTVNFEKDLAISGRQTDYGFEITTQSNHSFFAHKLIFATGIKDIFPSIKGFAECWGISVIHCPYCHGYEFRGKKTGILINGDKAFHISQLVNNLTNDLFILSNGAATFEKDALEKLRRNNISIIEKEILEIQHKNGHLENIIFKDGTRENFDAIYASVPFVQHSDIPKKLGCKINEQGYIEVNSFQQTTVQGIYACGDNTSPMRSVSNAVASGAFAGSILNKEITEERF